MKELVVISGKGGTGKTSLTAAFAALAKKTALADCDVDAADLHLLLQPTIRRRERFKSGHEAVIRSDECTGCGACVKVCRFDAIRPDGPRFRVESVGCEGCGVCARACPVKAIAFPERTGGEWFVSDTRFGPLAHARLTPGGENSGKLVALVREEARRLGRENGSEWVLIDGPPGIGCPVIASITGATSVLVITEPTVSGRHDLERVLGLTRHFNIPAAVCVNKWDINPEQTERIEQASIQAGARVAGRVRYDRAFTDAQIKGVSLVEESESDTVGDIKKVWAAMAE